MNAAAVAPAAPPVPPCPSWCVAEHEPHGWDETLLRADGSVDAITRVCRWPVDLIDGDEGWVEVVVEQTAGRDVVAGRWSEVHVCDPVVTLNCSPPRPSVTFAEASRIADAISTARERLSTAAGAPS